MNRRTFLGSLAGGLFVGSHAVEAQRTAQVPKIGYINVAPERNRFDVAFDKTLSDLGYVEGQNVAIERRYTGGRADRLASYAGEVVRLNSDVVVVWSTAGAVAMKQVTSTIPVVFLSVRDPIRLDVVTSFAHPGRNMTGVTFDTETEMYPKRLQLLKESLPGLSVVAILSSAEQSAFEPWAEIERASRALRLVINRYELRSPDQLEDMFVAMKSKGTNGLVVLASGFTFIHRQQIADLAIRFHLPTMNPFTDNVAAGGLMCYAASLSEIARQGATYVVKIIQGTKPAELPVEQPKKFELVINLKTAKALGLTIPPSLLLRADQVIE